MGAMVEFFCFLFFFCFFFFFLVVCGWRVFIFFFAVICVGGRWIWLVVEDGGFLFFFCCDLCWW